MALPLGWPYFTFFRAGAIDHYQVCPISTLFLRLFITLVVFSIMRIGLFPGTFDPITLGHIDIIDRALPLFDKLYIGIGRNANKKPLFPEEDRLRWIKEYYANDPRIEALVYEGLSVQCCLAIGATFILRGIRYVNDFEYEKAIADMNRSIQDGVESIFLTCSPQFTSVASTLVRDVFKNGGDVRQFLPSPVIKTLYP